jgi:hypothetical protein
MGDRMTAKIILIMGRNEAYMQNGGRELPGG